MKERKISRRAVCSAMVASLALGVLEGCGSSSSTTSSAAGSGAAASNERITVRILKSKAANEVAAEQMDVWKVLLSEYAAYLQNVLGIDTSLEQITEAACRRRELF